MACRHFMITVEDTFIHMGCGVAMSLARWVATTKSPVDFLPVTLPGVTLR